ncbi:50S ribosomal protein L21 [Rhodobacteraceae bacterium WD3A24]|nr:50S ribosomal protein L21 [Rhodobacteraceae bacterium WD3A24]
MFAVIKTGGKQYRVQPGDVLRVEKLAAEKGETVQFNDVLMLGGDTPAIGTPTIAGAGVQAEVLDQIKGEKVIHFVKRRRKHGSQRTKGHRQQLTVLRVADILASGADKSGVKAAMGAGSAPAPAQATKPAARKTGAAAKDAAPETEAAKPANLLDAARGGAPDDLKRITGVGPKLESVLHEAGVFHFDQIAAWSPEEVAYMEDKLSLRGRIERDDWIAQAAQFAAEKE